MVNCSVSSCKRRSATSNLREHGISYHKFPKDSELNELWTKCCGQYLNWSATRTSVICSEHFTPESFKTLSNDRRKLVDGAIPTLRSCQCTENKSLINIGFLPPSTVDNPGLQSDEDSAADVEEKPSRSSQSDTSRTKALKAKLRLKNKKIKRLQSKTRYLKNKVDTLSKLLQELYKKLMIDKEQKLNLEKLGVTEK